MKSILRASIQLNIKRNLHSPKKVTLSWKTRSNWMPTFFNITEYPYGVTQQPPNGSPTAVPSREFEENYSSKLITKNILWALSELSYSENWYSNAKEKWKKNGKFTTADAYKTIIIIIIMWNLQNNVCILVTESYSS
jgi:hypothetical protein